MVDCWMNYFDLVTHVVQEAESKEAGSPNSRKTVESICGKLEHCIENVDKLRHLVEDAIGARDSAHDDFLTEYDYLHSQLQSLQSFYVEFTKPGIASLNSSVHCLSVHHYVSCR